MGITIFSGYNVAADDNADWPKESPDWPAEIQSADELRAWIIAGGDTVEHFKTLPAYYLPLAAGKPTWLSDL